MLFVARYEMHTQIIVKHSTQSMSAQFNQLTYVAELPN